MRHRPYQQPKAIAIAITHSDTTSRLVQQVAGLFVFASLAAVLFASLL